MAISNTAIPIDRARGVPNVNAVSPAPHYSLDRLQPSIKPKPKRCLKSRHFQATLINFHPY